MRFWLGLGAIFALLTYLNLTKKVDDPQVSCRGIQTTRSWCDFITASPEEQKQMLDETADDLRRSSGR